MIDILVRLYDLAPLSEALEKTNAHNIVIRRPIGPEKESILEWVRTHFHDRWAAECETAFFNSPKTMYVAIEQGEKPKMLGFACWDATCRGFFGPTGVREDCRGKGVGNALLQACLHAMKEDGYGYAIIGSAGEKAKVFYEKTLPASSIWIPDSKPGVYKNML